MRLTVLLLLLLATPLRAQTSGPETRPSYASRSDLEAQATAAEAVAARPDTPSRLRATKQIESAMVRHRLAIGDFAVGDRIALVVRGDTTLSDTVLVRAGQVVQLGTLPPIPLAGVLRSELESHLRTEVGRFLHDERVDAVPLLRIAVLGQVARPGYYNVPADMLLSDVIMLAGGPGANADLQRSSIRRGTADIWSAGDVQIALLDGFSLDQLNVRGGDVLTIGERRRTNWLSVTQVFLGLGGLVALVMNLAS